MGSPRRILVVEDEWLIAAEMEDMLSSVGCEVVGPAPSVAQALALLDEHRVEAAMLDVHLNGETSFPVADALIARNIPFVFVSGFALADLPTAFRDCALLRKPVREDMILRHVAEMKRP